MKLLILVSSEASYKQLREGLSNHEIAPFTLKDSKIQQLIHDYEADVAIVEVGRSDYETLETLLTYYGIGVVDYSGIIEETITEINSIDPERAFRDNNIAVIEQVVQKPKQKILKRLTRFWKGSSDRKEEKVEVEHQEEVERERAAAEEEAERRGAEEGAQEAAMLAAQLAEEEAESERAAAEEEAERRRAEEGAQEAAMLAAQLAKEEAERERAAAEEEAERRRAEEEAQEAAMLAQLAEEEAERERAAAEEEAERRRAEEEAQEAAMLAAQLAEEEAERKRAAAAEEAERRRAEEEAQEAAMLAAQLAEEEAERKRAAAAEEAERRRAEEGAQEAAMLAAQLAEEEAERERAAAAEEAERRRAEEEAQEAAMLAAQLAEEEAERERAAAAEEAAVSQSDSPKVSSISERRERSELKSQFEINGTKVIAVGGFGRRTGSTYTALQIAQFLKAKKMKVACVELAPTPQTAAFKYFVEQGRQAGGGYHWKGVTYFANWPIERLHELYGGHFSFVVLDCGGIADISDVGEISERVVISEFFRADVSVVSTFTSLWDSLNFVQLALHLKGKGWSKPIYILAQSSSDDCAEIKKLIPQGVRRSMEMYFYASFPSQDAFTPEDRIQHSISQVLSMFFTEKRSSKFSFFAKKG
ncbi:hypothetical protein J6TS7_38280 [Paenibacillus dendritiformis]|uniref:hypothetical protein n=1 Tax=Paenibacillus dendritiformis TaxID=130049 RepID=UPI001B1CBB76|nr:hypothetical protein [Paenibacillus dendritiformis]GIO80218.1 hypothetical protein J6TS7_38280 [Paenibacillus dendritiformis]